MTQDDDLRLLSRSQYTAKYGISDRKWGYLREEAGLRRHFHGTQEAHAMEPFPPGILPALPAELTYTGESVLIAADWHVPHHDEGMAERLLKVAEREDVKRLIICGDFLNQDVFFRGGQDKHPAMVSFKEELGKARDVLHALLDVFDAVTWLAGNHEQRLFRTSKGEVDMEMLLTLVAGGTIDVSRVDVTDRDYVLLHHEDPDFRWRVTHGVGGSASIATNAAVVKVDIYGMNVAQGHNHLVGVKQSKNGRHLGMDVGCMLRPEWAAYKSLNTNTYPMWNQGFALIRDGKPTQFTRRWTEWDRYGADER